MPYKLLFSALLVTALAAAQTPELRCSALTQINAATFPNHTVAITAATLKPASQAITNPGGRGNVPALPPHCEVIGRLNERTGASSQHYAIKFHMRLPVAWNNKFFFEGGGGSNGNLGDAYGNLQGQQTGNALTLGYAVVSQDSGHDNSINNDPTLNGAQTFGFDEQARLDFGYNSYDQVTQTAKALIKTYYGKGPERSYYVGCSEGGREAMLMSQRFPDYFDGILACSPGFKLPKAAIAEAWDTQVLAAVPKALDINDPSGQPFVNKAFTDEDLNLVSRAVLDACDNLDGLPDGIISNFAACNAAVVHPKLAALTCKGAKQPDCLTGVQITALEKVFAGPKNSKGQPLYSDWTFDAGISNPGWRVWKLGLYNAPTNSSINVMLGSAAISAVFTTPPTPVAATGPAPLKYLLDFNFDTEAAKIYAESGAFAKASWDFMRADSTNLAAFKKHGGKLLITHGVSDPIFSVNDTISWFNDVTKLHGGNASDFVRFFPVPGMTHCGGGPSTDRYDAFAALVAWVEKKTPPDSIVAAAGLNTPWPGRTRPLCPYPAYPHYDSGSIEDASSFTCK